MTTPALRLQLADARQLRAALTDARQLRAALTVGAMPETTRGAVISVEGRVPMLSTTGTPPAPVASPWGVGGTAVSPVAVAAAVELRDPEPAHYAPGPLRPIDANGMTRDTIEVADDFGVVRYLYVYWKANDPDYAPPDQALDVPIGTDGVAALYTGGTLALTATGGTGPYTWDFVHNRSGGTLTVGGSYVAGPLVGIDRLRVTDSLGEIALVQAEVLAGQLGANFAADPVDDYALFNVYGYACQPYARVWGEGGTAPYTVAMYENQTGASIVPAKPRRAAFALLDLAGAPVDLTGWAFDARLYGQRGGVLASGLVVTTSGNVVEVEIPEPGELLFTPAVLRVEADTAGSILALGVPTLAIETLLVASET